MASSISPLPRPTLSRAADQPTAGGIRFAITSLQSGGPLDLGVETLPPGEGPPLHVHRDVDEYVVVLSGRLRCRIDGDDLDLEAGDAAVIARGAEHTFTNLGDEPCELVWVILGGGFHPFLADLDAAGTFDPAVVGPIAERHGHTLTGPPLAALLGA